MIRRTAAPVLALVLLAPGCAGEASTTSAAASAAPSVATTAVSTTTTTAPTTTTTPVAPSILAMASGRGDDGSLEAAVWLAADPFAEANHRVVIGTDADESYPGVGDPLPHLDGRLEITDERAALYDGSEEVASGEALREAATWALAGDGALRVFFIGTVPIRAGMLWVIVEVDDQPVPGGVAGVPVGERCSHHGSGMGIDSDTSVPDSGTPCRYWANR